MNENSSQNNVIGLDVGGQVFYCHRATLMNCSGSYFSARFGPDNMLPPGDSYMDERGREVYFIDRDGRHFEYVLQYLRTGSLRRLPEFHENKDLWRALREEADYYMLEGMSYLLKVTYSCTPSRVPGGDQGVFHYLGTRHGQSDVYQNPYALGVVDIGGSIDAPGPPYEDPVSTFDEDWDADNDCKYRARLIQYRPRIESLLLSWPTPLHWHRGNVDKTIHVELKDVEVRPTHYSLRYGGGNGLTADWAFEASTDGQEWITLHEAQSDSYIRRPPNGEKMELSNTLMARSGNRTPVSEGDFSFLTAFAEQNYRGTWKLDDLDERAFYRFFRIRKTSSDGELLGCGFEVFGDVSET